MITIAKQRAAVLGAMAMAGVITGYALRTAHADGIPETDALTYAGVLEDDAGQPLSGAKTIQVSVFPSANGGVASCTATSSQNVVAGHFEVTLPAACVTAVRTNKDAFVEVIVDAKSLGRSRIGAVPFAVEASRANGASGALAARLAQLEQAPVSAFTSQTAALTVPSGGVWTDVPGLSVSFEAASLQDVDIDGNIGVNGTAAAANGAITCRFRFVLDGTPLGPTGTYDAEAEITLHSGSTTAAGDGQIRGMRRQKLSPGAHTLKAQVSTDPGSVAGGSCSPYNGRLRARGAP